MASHSLGLSLHEAARRMGVPFTVESEPVDRFVSANGLRLHYLEWGPPASGAPGRGESESASGKSDLPTIVMLHGISQQAHSWDFISLPLSVDYRVLAVDQRGHGDSDWAPDGDYSTDAYAADLAALVEALGLRDFHLMGHSMGGRNSLAWASQNPGILRSLTIVDTGPETQRRGQNRIQQFRELPDELDTLEEFAQRVMEYTGRNREQTMGSLKYSIRQRAEDGKWTWKYDKAIRAPGFRAPAWTPEQLWDGWRRIDCPALVVRGARSDIFAESTMARMAAEHGRGDCATVTIANAGHLVQGDNPPDFLAAVRGLLGRFE